MPKRDFSAMANNLFTMPSSAVLLAFSVAFGLSNALPWPGPEPTASYKSDDWTPRPTNSPRSPAELFKRESLPVNICGWFGGNVSAEVGCETGSSCIHDTIYGFVGCCTTAGACTSGVYTSCMDLYSVSSGSVGQVGVTTCVDTSVCNQNTYAGGYLQFSCGPVPDASFVATTYTGQPADLLLQVVYTGIQLTYSSSTTTSSTTSSSSITSSSTSSSSSSVSASPSTSPTSGISKAEEGEIIGGTIGGLALVLGVSGLAAFLLRRNRRKVARKYRAPSFVPGNPPNSAPFQRIPFSPDDFGGRHSDFVTPAAFPTAYQPLNVEGNFVNAYATPPREELPLISEIEDFSSSWNSAIAGQRSPDMVERDPRTRSGRFSGAIAGIGLGVITNQRTQDVNAGSEELRISQNMQAPSSTSNGVQNGSTADTDVPIKKYELVDAAMDD